MKIVGIGLNRTGTTTLGQCMRHWGLRHVSCSREAFDLWREGDTENLLQLIDAHDSFDDWPWPLVYKEIDARYPGTKFILTRRKDPQTWFDSLCKHAVRTGPTDFRRYIYGYDMPQDHAAEHIRYYEAHLEDVRTYFKDRPTDLLEVCWEDGDGWAELAAFLGFEAPNAALPHVNRSSAYQFASPYWRKLTL